MTVVSHSDSSVSTEVTFEELHDEGFERAPFEVLARLRRECPIYWDDLQTSWFVTRYHDVVNVLRNGVTFSNRAKQQTMGSVFGQAGALTSMDGELHVERRKIVASELVGERLRAYVGIIEQNARSLIDGFAARGRVDLVKEFADRLPMSVMIQMFGFPASDEEKLEEWTRLMFGALTSKGDVHRRGVRAHKELAEYAEPLIAERLACPASDLISKFVHSPIADHRYGFEEVQGLISQIFTAGVETTARAIAAMWYNLLKNPDQLSAASARPELWDNAFSETLRRDPPVIGNTREVTTPVEVCGRRLWPGELVEISILSANHDDEVFANPEQFDLHRDDLHFGRELRTAAPDELGKAGHLGFGVGPHFCAGYQLARFEATIGSRLLAEVMRNPRLTHPDEDAPAPGSRFGGPKALRIAFDPV
jgi:pulcherriminic acid synthase